MLWKGDSGCDAKNEWRDFLSKAGVSTHSVPAHSALNTCKGPQKYVTTKCFEVHYRIQRIKCIQRSETEETHSHEKGHMCRKQWGQQFNSRSRRTI